MRRTEHPAEQVHARPGTTGQAPIHPFRKGAPQAPPKAAATSMRTTSSEATTVIDPKRDSYRYADTVLSTILGLECDRILPLVNTDSTAPS